jgi:allantoinase
MKPDLRIVNGLVANHWGCFRGGLAIKDGVIVAVGEDDALPRAEKTLDVEGKLIIPGAIDTHVHFEDPGMTHFEDFTTGTMAAAAGGVTTVIDMPLDNDPNVTDAASLMAKQQAVKSKALVDYALWGGLVTDNGDALEGMHDLGVVGYKAFLQDFTMPGFAGYPAADDGVLFEGMRRLAAWGSVLAIHCENPEIIARVQARLRKQGRQDRAAFLESRPPIAELEAIQRVILLARAAGARVHIAHLSLPEGGELVRQARISGLDITVETCPHYLAFDEEDFLTLGAQAKCQPPMRPRACVEGLWKQVMEGTVDCLASDHSPCLLELKEQEDLWDVWSGISGVQHLLQLVVSEGVHKRGMSLPRLVSFSSTRAAEIFGFYPRKGALAVGSDADLAVVDLDAEWEVTKEELFYKNKQTPYVGMRLRGKVVKTLVRGAMVYDRGVFGVSPGYGKLLRTKPSQSRTTSRVEEQ